MRMLCFLNSDFGVQNTIGARALPIANKSIKNKIDLTIYCRGFNKKYKNKFDIIRILPFGSFIMKVLTAVPIYVSKRISTNKLKTNIFEHFLIKKLRKIDLSNVEIIHSWDYLPKAYSYIKSVNPKIKIVQDIAMALPNVLESIKDEEKLWKGEKLSLPDYIKESFDYIDYFIAPSEFVRKSLMNEGISKDRIFLVPFGVDTEQFKPLENKDFNGVFKAAFCGNINNRKGIPYLIEAWKGLNLENAELNLYGRVYPEVRQYLKDGERYGIKIHGFADVSEELPKNHVYVFPSLLEGSSKSVYEALACGLPVITTFNSGSVVKDGKEGFVIPIQNTKALKEKILFFYTHKEKIKSFGKRARRLAEKYTWEDYGERIMKIYLRVIK